VWKKELSSTNFLSVSHNASMHAPVCTLCQAPVIRKNSRGRDMALRPKSILLHPGRVQTMTNFTVKLQELLEGSFACARRILYLTWCELLERRIFLTQLGTVESLDPLWNSTRNTSVSFPAPIASVYIRRKLYTRIYIRMARVDIAWESPG